MRHGEEFTLRLPVSLTSCEEIFEAPDRKMSGGMLVSEAGSAAAAIKESLHKNSRPNSPGGRSSEALRNSPKLSKDESSRRSSLLGRKSPEPRAKYPEPEGKVLGLSAEDVQGFSRPASPEPRFKLGAHSNDRPANVHKHTSRPNVSGIPGLNPGSGKGLCSDTQATTEKDDISSLNHLDKKLPAPGDDRVSQAKDGVPAAAAGAKDQGSGAGAQNRVSGGGRGMGGGSTKDGASAPAATDGGSGAASKNKGNGAAESNGTTDKKAAMENRIAERLAYSKNSLIAKAHIVGFMANKLVDVREQRKEQALLNYYMEGLKSDDWMKRKIAVDESLDMILANVSQAKAAHQISVVDEQYDLVQLSILPLLSDMNWRVRKSVIRGLHQLAKLEARRVKSMLLPLINSAPTYAGRWSSASVALSIASPSEENFRKKMTEAMLIALSDEHWIVRQEALEALPQLVQTKDDAVIQRGLELLRDELPSLRRTGIEVLRRYTDESARHDPMTDVQLAKRLLRTALIGKNAFDACDVNGNGLLSVRELRAALRDKYDIRLSLKRMVVFVKDFHDKDMTFFNFMDLVKSHMTSADAIEKEHAKEKVNKKRLAQQLLDEMVETLPVDYSSMTMTLRLLKSSLEAEQDWMTKDKLHSMCLSMAPMFDKDVPVLLNRGLTTFNAKLCLASCRTLLSLANDLEDPAYHASLLKGFTHIFRPATEEAAAAMVEESWDLLHALSERLALPNLEVKIAVIQCLQRFWDRGQAAHEAQRKLDTLQLRTKRFQQDVINQLNKAAEQAAREEKAPVAGRRGSLIERVASSERRSSMASNSGMHSVMSNKSAHSTHSAHSGAGGAVLWTVETFMALDHATFEHENDAVMDKFKDWRMATVELKQTQERHEWFADIDHKIAEHLKVNTEHEDPTLSDDSAMLLNDWNHAQDKRKSNANWKGAGVAAMVGVRRLSSSPTEFADHGAFASTARTSSTGVRRLSSVQS